MSLEVHKYIENALDSKTKLLKAEIINFPQQKEANNFKIWKLYDKLNDNEDKDQLKTVIGICFVFSTLTILGFYSNFVL
mgnify:FL=1|tara:strand:+ start:332 stop:568 length:237 start_codon:yes stop_codon:yes gene_type:complete